MDRSELKEKLTDLFRRYRYAVLVLALGLVLMWLPSGKTEETQTAAADSAASSTDPQEALANILSKIQGVGKVEVLLTVAEGERILYETDEDSSFGADSGSTRTEVVVVTDENRAQQGLVRQVIPPTYLGAVIVCQGGDQPSVRLAVVEAVAAVTGLTSDKISVLKMK